MKEHQESVFWEVTDKCMYDERKRKIEENFKSERKIITQNKKYRETRGRTL